MAIQMQVMAPGSGKAGSITVNGRSYTCALGSVITVPFHDGQALMANGWIPVCANGSGTTADRPIPGSTPLFQQGRPGGSFHDTTIGVVIVWDGFAWRNPLTGAAV